MGPIPYSYTLPSETMEDPTENIIFPANLFVQAKIWIDEVGILTGNTH